MAIRIDGLDEAKKRLEQLKQNAEGSSGEHTVPYFDLFAPEFMAEYTNFKSIDEMFQAGGFKIRSNEDLKKIPEDEWNGFIQKHTQFQEWDEMIKAAWKKYFVKKLSV
jgi:hypothetical protein